MNPTISYRKYYNYDTIYNLILDIKKEIDQGHDVTYMPSDLNEYWYCEQTHILYGIMEFDLFLNNNNIFLGFPQFPSGTTRGDRGWELITYLKENAKYIDKLISLKAFA